MKASSVGFLLLFAASQANADFSEIWDISEAIPDNKATGWSDTRTLFDIEGDIVDVTVHLKLTGGWNGDLYGYLQHGSGFSVLLNRPGRTAGNPDGSSVSGMDAIFSDSATVTTHDAGIFSWSLLQPDGRPVSPFVISDPQAGRTAMLSDFIGLDPNGTWTLFMADLSPIGTSTVVNWGLTIETSAVPETGTFAGAGFLLACGLFARRREHGGTATGDRRHS